MAGNVGGKYGKGQKARSIYKACRKAQQGCQLYIVPKGARATGMD